MFFGSFAWSFVFVSLPFHIQRVSTPGAAGHLAVDGLDRRHHVARHGDDVAGVGPLWPPAATRRPATWRSRRCKVSASFVMALARTLPELFFARLILGAMGAASTLAFIMVGRSVEGADVRRRIATLQSAMTVDRSWGRSSARSPRRGWAFAARSCWAA